jgi:hypothetical protein
MNSELLTCLMVERLVDTVFAGRDIGQDLTTTISRIMKDIPVTSSLTIPLSLQHPDHAHSPEPRQRAGKQRERTHTQKTSNVPSTRWSQRLRSAPMKERGAIGRQYNFEDGTDRMLDDSTDRDIQDGMNASPRGNEPEKPSDLVCATCG